MRRLVLAIIISTILSQGWGQAPNPPPVKPLVHAAAGNGKVTLYWDERPTEAPDFEGYIIHRSTEPTFQEVQTITGRLETIQQAMDDAPKTLAWKMRDKVVTRVRWYDEVEEVQRT